MKNLSLFLKPVDIEKRHKRINNPITNFKEDRYLNSSYTICKNIYISKTTRTLQNVEIHSFLSPRPAISYQIPLKRYWLLVGIGD